MKPEQSNDTVSFPSAPAGGDQAGHRGIVVRSVDQPPTVLHLSPGGAARSGKAAAVVVTVVASLFAVPAAPAQAAGTCWRSSGKWWCNNVSGGPMYDWLGRDGTTRTRVDTLRTTTSWFTGYSECRSGLYDNGTTAPHPYRWIRTMGDDNGVSGWVSDKDVYSETNSLPNLGPCMM